MITLSNTTLKLWSNVNFSAVTSEWVIAEKDAYLARSEQCNRKCSLYLFIVYNSKIVKFDMKKMWIQIHMWYQVSMFVFALLLLIVKRKNLWLFSVSIFRLSPLVHRLLELLIQFTLTFFTFEIFWIKQNLAYFIFLNNSTVPKGTAFNLLHCSDTSLRQFLCINRYPRILYVFRLF